MGGIGVLRQQRRFNAFRSAILQANPQLVLQLESTVRFMRNGSLYIELRLHPGRYDFSLLTPVAGRKAVVIIVNANRGTVHTQSDRKQLNRTYTKNSNKEQVAV